MPKAIDTRRSRKTNVLREKTRSPELADGRYHRWFEDMPVSLWEEDLSALKAYLDDLRKRGITDLRAYLTDNLEEISHCIKLVSITDVNQSTVKMYQAGSKKKLFAGMNRIFTADAYRVFKEEISTLAEGHTHFESEVLTRTFKGDDKNVYLTLNIAPGYENTWERVLLSLTDISSLKQTEEELRLFSNRLIRKQEEERGKIARELHDEIGQSVTVLKLMFDTIRRLPPENIKSVLDEAEATVNELITQVRNLSLDLRPGMLDDLGLLPALLWHIDKFTAKTQIKVNFKHQGIRTRFPPELTLAVYRIIEEALTNVLQHAGVSEVDITARSDKKVLWIRVQDKGKGFNRDAVLPRNCGGLFGMRERARSLAGELTVDSTPGMGTIIIARLPLSREKGYKGK